MTPLVSHIYQLSIETDCERAHKSQKCWFKEALLSTVKWLSDGRQYFSNISIGRWTALWRYQISLKSKIKECEWVNEWNSLSIVVSILQKKSNDRNQFLNENQLNNHSISCQMKSPKMNLKKPINRLSTTNRDENIFTQTLSSIYHF